MVIYPKRFLIPYTSAVPILIFGAALAKQQLELLFVGWVNEKVDACAVALEERRLGAAEASVQTQLGFGHTVCCATSVAHGSHLPIARHSEERQSQSVFSCFSSRVRVSMFLRVRVLFCFEVFSTHPMNAPRAGHNRVFEKCFFVRLSYPRDMGS